MGCIISEGARWGLCLPATGRQQMQHALVLAEHTDHLLRFSFIASIRVERPRAGNDQRKTVVPRCGAPQSVCFPEIELGLGLKYCQVTLVTCKEKKGVHVSTARPHWPMLMSRVFINNMVSFPLKASEGLKWLVCQSAANGCVYVCVVGWRVNVVDPYWKKGRISPAGKNTTLQEQAQPNPVVNPSPWHFTLPICLQAKPVSR